MHEELVEIAPTGYKYMAVYVVISSVVGRLRMFKRAEFFYAWFSGSIRVHEARQASKSADENKILRGVGLTYAGPRRCLTALRKSSTSTPK
jgi:hypothetical protein